MLELISITKFFNVTRALDNVSLTVNAGEIVSLLGPSGCGKSTLLAIVAGLETPDVEDPRQGAGEVRWAGENLAGVPAHRRRFGLMFQDYALFPHRDVFDNVAFGLRMHAPRLPGGEIARQVREALALVNLAGFEGRDVNTLSGGEAQRVKLACQLLRRPGPRVLYVLDEPTTGLHQGDVNELLGCLQRLLDGGATLLVIEHNLDVIKQADWVIDLGPEGGAEGGHLVFQGTPEAVAAQGTGLTAPYLRTALNGHLSR